MGNVETTSEKEKNKSVQISHPVFQSAQLIKTLKGKQMIEIAVPMKSEKDYIDWTKNYKRIPKVSTVLYPQEMKFENKGCCGSSGIAKIQYMGFLNLLSKEVQIRRKKNYSYFGQKQLWFLLLNLVQATQMFHIRKVKLGDIRLQNVFMNSEGQVKIFSQYSYPYGQTNYEKSIVNRQMVTYLAPQEVKDIQFGKMKDMNDPLTVESFSIGLTMLDAAILESSEKFYQKIGVFNFDQLKESLRRLASNNYSPQLTYIITKMCDPQPANRLKGNQVLKMLRSFENEILSKKQFNIQALPSGNSQQNKQPISPSNPVMNPQNNNNNNNKFPNQIQKKDEYTFVPGVVFDANDEKLIQSTLMRGKETPSTNSKIPNIYTLSEQGQIANLKNPVQTTIYYPPITIQLPQPVHHNGHNNHA